MEYLSIENTGKFSQRFQFFLCLFFAVIMLCTARAQLRKIMLRAYSMGMCNGNFVFLALYSFPKAFYTDPTDRKEESMPLWYGNDTDDETAKQAFQVVFDVSKFRFSCAAPPGVRVQWVSGIKTTWSQGVVPQAIPAMQDWVNCLVPEAPQ